VNEIFLRILIGGTVVSAFALLSDLFKQKRYAVTAGTAASVALATLGMTIVKEEKWYAAVEARSMMGGAIAFFVYAYCVYLFMMRYKPSALAVALLAIPVWLGTALGLWWVWLR